MNAALGIRQRLQRIETSEHWLNVVGLVFLALVTIEMATTYSMPNSDRRLWLLFANVICFNSGHVAFTFVNIWTIPEFRKLTQNHFRLTWLRQLAIFAIICILFLLVFDRGFRTDIVWLRVPVVLGIILFPALHSVRQSLGMSLLLNSKRISPEAVNAKVDKQSRGLEHLSAWLLILGSCLLIGWQYHELLHLDLRYIGSALNLSLICMAFSLALFIWAVQLHNDPQLRFEKLLFGIRNLIRAFAPLSYFAVVYSSAIHGLEYVQLQHRTLRSPQLTKNCIKMTFLLCVIFFLVHDGLDYSEGPPGHRWFNESWLTRTASILGATFTYVHYHLDSLIYRMRDPVVRSAVLPIIKSA